MGKDHIKKRQPYNKPTATPIRAEDAKQNLLARISNGDQQAWEMFEELFPEDAEKIKRRSA